MAGSRDYDSQLRADGNAQAFVGQVGGARIRGKRQEDCDERGEQHYKVPRKSPMILRSYMVVSLNKGTPT